MAVELLDRCEAFEESAQPCWGHAGSLVLAQDEDEDEIEEFDDFDDDTDEEFDEFGDDDDYEDDLDDDGDDDEDL